MSRKNETFANVSENVDIASFISMFCQCIIVINVAFCNSPDKFVLGKTL